MKSSQNRSLKLGLLVAVGLILFSLAIYYLGSQQNLFSSTINIKSYFNDVRGLVEGNKVRYSGITIGYVSHIEIINDTTILVEMSVDKDISQFIRKDSKAEITSDGLMGSQILNIYPGSSDAQRISENEFIMSQSSPNLQEVIEKAQRIMETGQLTFNNLLEISNKISNGEGDLARLLNDDAITTKLNQVGEEILGISKTTGKIIAKVDNGEGDMGRLVNDTVISGNVNRLVVNLNQVTSRADSVTIELKRFTSQLNEGNGLITRLAYDTKMANKIDTALVKVNMGIIKATEAAETIEKSWIFNLFSKNK